MSDFFSIYVEHLLDRVDPHVELNHHSHYQEQIAAGRWIVFRRQQLNYTLRSIEAYTGIPLISLQLIESGVAHPRLVDAPSLQSLVQLLSDPEYPEEQVAEIVATALGTNKQALFPAQDALVKKQLSKGAPPLSRKIRPHIWLRLSRHLPHIFWRCRVQREATRNEGPVTTQVFYRRSPERYADKDLVIHDYG